MNSDIIGRLDYQILNTVNNYYDPDYKGYRYDSVYWSITVWNEKLLNELNKKFKCNIILKEPLTISEALASKIFKFVSNKKEYSGIYGQKYLNEHY